jgi:CheY-like chemotaxis protein
MGIMARVLIVEDDQADRIILANIVEQAGHEVFFASGGEAALQLYAKRGIEIVVTDLQMPDGDGLELIDALKSMFPAGAIIVVSGMRPELLAEVKSRAAVVALSKPVDPHELLETLAQAAQDRPVAARRNGS